MYDALVRSAHYLLAATPSKAVPKFRPAKCLPQS